MNRTCALATGWCLALAMMAAAAGEPAPPSVPSPQAEFFESKIRPVLAENCFSCHGPKKQSSGLRLDSLPALLQGGDNGPVIVPGDPDHSRLVQAVRHVGLLKMPPKLKLKPQAVEALAAWV